MHNANLGASPAFNTVAMQHVGPNSRSLSAKQRVLMDKKIKERKICYLTKPQDTGRERTTSFYWINSKVLLKYFSSASPVSSFTSQCQWNILARTNCSKQDFCFQEAHFWCHLKTNGEVSSPPAVKRTRVLVKSKTERMELQDTFPPQYLKYLDITIVKMSHLSSLFRHLVESGRTISSDHRVSPRSPQHHVENVAPIM